MNLHIYYLTEDKLDDTDPIFPKTTKSQLYETLIKKKHLWGEKNQKYNALILYSPGCHWNVIHVSLYNTHSIFKTELTKRPILQITKNILAAILNNGRHFYFFPYFIQIVKTTSKATTKTWCVKI